MSGYLSSLLTSSTEKYNTLRRTLQSEADGDTEDDSHISRALRNYYTDAGRGLPPWLPPDPKKASQTQVSYGQQGQYGQQQGQYGQPDPGYGQRPAYGQSQQQSLRQNSQYAQQRGGGQQAYTAQPQSLRQAGQASYGGGMQRQDSSGSTAQERLKARLWGQAGRGAPAGQGR